MKVKKILFFLLCSLFFLSFVLKKTKPFGEILKEVTYSKAFFDNEGRLLRLSLSEDEKYRVFLSLNEISEQTKKAALLYEDRFFYYHFGVNPASLLRAFYSTYVSKKRRLGGSTITMQVSRNLYKFNTKNLRGKLKQIAGALWLDFSYSKDEVLEAYLNIIPYGFNIEGVGAASLVYFDKENKDLNLIESLSLTVLPQSPFKRTKGILKNERADSSLIKARLNLLNMWNKAYQNEMTNKEDFLLSFKMRSPKNIPFKAPHFIDDLYYNHYDDLKKENNVYLSLDLELQSILESVGKTYLRSAKKKNIENYSALLIDANTMSVKASIGSADFFDDSINGQVNGVKAKRSPGSALKPFVYALAIDQGILHQKTMLLDTPTPFGTYTPDNFDYNFAGPISMHHALIYSRNIPALLVANKLKNPSFYDFLKSTGLSLNEDPMHYGLSIVLGSAEVNMEELSQMYALFVNKGRYKKINKFRLKDKAYGFNAAKGDFSKRLLSEEASFLIRDSLYDNAPPNEDMIFKWRQKLNNVAWKTGTSMGHRDAWAVGVFGDHVLAVWVGNFSGAGQKAFVGREAAGPLFFRMVDAVINHENLDVYRPEGFFGLNLKKVEVCSLSGQLAHKDCRHKEKAFFIPGVSPITTCEVHKRVQVEVLSGLISCASREVAVRERVYEYWPSEVEELYRQAGISKLKPPRLHEDCRGSFYGSKPPRILSPKENMSYTLRTKGADAKEIPFIARGEGGVKKFEWFVNNLSVGFSKPDRPFLWSSKPGAHDIRVEDDLGRSASRKLNVERVE